jgi:hypothetical protein
MTILEVLAELSVAILGFSGITVVLGHSKFDALSAGTRIQGLILSSGIALILSVLPIIGLHLAISSVLAIVLTLSFAFWAIWTIYRGMFKANVWLTVFAVGVGAACCIWLAYVLAVGRGNLIDPYIALVGFTLLQAAVFYIRVVLSINMAVKEDA